MAIQSFADKAPEKFFLTGHIPGRVGWSNVRKVVMRKLDMLHYAALLSDVKSPPGNRLESLKVDLAGFHSIRVNDQWRVIFRWTHAGPAEVRVADYH